MKKLYISNPLRRDMNRVIGSGILSGVYIATAGAMFGSVFLFAFARKFGMSKFEIALLASTTHFANIMQFIACYLMENYITRKKFLLRTAYAGRALWIVASFIPTLLARRMPEATIGVFFFIVIISNILHFFAATAWLSWLKDIIPHKHRATFFARKNFLTGIAMLTVPYIVGKILDQHDIYLTYSLIFSFFALLSIWGTSLFSKIKDTHEFIREKIDWHEIFKIPLKNKNFRFYLLFSMTLAFATAGMAPFFALFLLEDLEFSKATIGFFSFISIFMTIVMYLFWGKVSRKVGHRNTLFVAVPIMIMLPFLATMANKSNAFLIMVIVHLFSGVIWSGINLASINLLLSISPKKRNTAYMSVFYFMNGIMGVLSPIAASGIIHLFEGRMAFPVKAWFISSGIIRMVAFIFLLQVKDIKFPQFRFRYFFKTRY